ncbi:glycosyltransferase family 2 protein [uncultured Muribaculum sp.]|uniref:glycosyltransferase family 2 protein n=1 Tax=uncultured Muribaculum sp. TaxID=1918613 RepID=UPI002597F6D8|nr:glycosyltransferase family 2 protein [uncultured Muribaculum sp.]
MVTLNSVVVIIVLYFPSEEQIALISRLENINLILVDNTPYEKGSPIGKLFRSNITYVSLNENKGIAYAQNEAIKIAQNKGYHYIIFFDQDSKIDLKIIEALYNEIINLNKNFSNVGALGPKIIDSYSQKTSKAYSSELENQKYIEVPTLISSGTIVPIHVFKEVGMFDSSLFIDYVDHEWCWRCGVYGFLCFQTNQIRLNHPVGKRTISFGALRFIESSPFRYFYQYRNYLILLKRNYVPLNWKIKTGIKNIAGVLIYPSISKNKVQSIKNILKGIFSGLLKK